MSDLKIELEEERKLKAKHPTIQRPGSEFLQKRLQRGQKYFDSGDYNMAKASTNQGIKLPDGATPVNAIDNLIRGRVFEDNISLAQSGTDNKDISVREPIQISLAYHNYDELTDLMKNVSTRYPDLVRLYSIGTSVQGRELWVAMVSGDVQNENQPLKPHVKLVGNIHGNEAVGRELLLQLLVYLVNSYPANEQVKYLLEKTYIHLLPSMNPDGFEMSSEGKCSLGKGRGNANGFDLNRNFPDFFSPNKFNPNEEQPETRATRVWMDQILFILSANLHGGALVASYPFDNKRTTNSNDETGSSSPSPDDDVFKHLAEVYSFNHKTMFKGERCPTDNKGFVNGTTNGAEWYLLEGGMQDYNYYWSGCMEITLEVSCCKYPNNDQLLDFWDQNKRALLAYLAEATKGVRGSVSDSEGVPVSSAKLTVKGRSFSFKANKRGEFWRILLPGEYVLQVEAPGFEPTEVEFTVGQEEATVLEVKMKPNHGVVIQTD